MNLILEDDTPLARLPPPRSRPRSTGQIAANVAALVDDRATIQLGFGTIPMVIGRLLADRKELGIHTELFCQSHLDLIEAGSVTNAHKGLYDGVSVGNVRAGRAAALPLAEGKPCSSRCCRSTEINAVPVLARVRTG